jgi:uncharacterized protein YbbC (DUF1343 family)
MGAPEESGRRRGRRRSAALSAWSRRVTLIAALLLAACGRRAGPPAPGVRTGLDVLAAGGFAALRGRRVGVIANPTSVARDLRPLAELVAAAPGVTLVAIFGPEHGASGASTAGAHVGDATDERTGVPVYSLYGQARRPTPDMLRGVDLLLFDMQEVGARPYTYLSTLVESLGAAAEAGIDFWVLDRPAPLFADAVEGPVLEPAFESFVGPHAIPLRHGLTIGEFARLANAERNLGARLRVVPLEGYRRDLAFADAGLLWIAPSPNLPTLDAAFAYAGMVLLEGTNLSEGRGTTRPFQIAGAPWLDGVALAGELAAAGLGGATFRPLRFVPWDSKHEGVECGGVEVHIMERRTYRSVATAVALIAGARKLHPGEFAFRPETFDRLAGTASLREAIERGEAVSAITASWEPALKEYLERRKSFLLYP